MTIDYKKFEKTALVREPFEHIVVEDFILSSDLEKILRDFPESNSDGSLPLSSLKCGEKFLSFTKELVSEKFTKAVEKKFGIDLSSAPTMMTVRGRANENNGQIHIDSKGKVLTFLVYFNEEWTSEGGRLRLLNDGQNIENYFNEIVPKAGTLVAFKCVENAWHGHKPFSGQRRSIQLNWVRDETYLKKEQYRHKISSFFKSVKKKVFA